VHVGFYGGKLCRIDYCDYSELRLAGCQVEAIDDQELSFHHHHIRPLGVYDHIPGDGRELVVSNPYTTKIRAGDGRRIEKVDITPFIANLPFGQDSRAFSTNDASGSTSQAANIIESLELGAQVLLIDEDTSATNFMIRDRQVQQSSFPQYLLSHDSCFSWKDGLLHSQALVSAIHIDHVAGYIAGFFGY